MVRSVGLVAFCIIFSHMHPFAPGRMRNGEIPILFTLEDDIFVSKCHTVQTDIQYLYWFVNRNMNQYWRVNMSTLLWIVLFVVITHAFKLVCYATSNVLSALHSHIPASESFVVSYVNVPFKWAEMVSLKTCGFIFWNSHFTTISCRNQTVSCFMKSQELYTLLIAHCDLPWIGNG